MTRIKQTEEQNVSWSQKYNDLMEVDGEQLSRTRVWVCVLLKEPHREENTPGFLRKQTKH